MFLENRHAGSERANPPLWHSRYVHLRRLKTAVLSALESCISGRDKPVLVDLGCGNKPYQGMISGKVGTYVGVDIPGNPVADCFVDMETGRCPLASASADIVFSIQVLEHVESPASYLREAHRLLRDDGDLLLSTHGHWMYHPDPVDHWRWTSTGLKLELERCGFQVTSFHGVQGFLSAALQMLQDAVLASFPLGKYWNKPFCFLVQRMITLSEFFIDRSRTLSKHRDIEAAAFVLVARKK